MKRIYFYLVPFPKQNMRFVERIPCWFICYVSSGCFNEVLECFINIGHYSN